MGLTSTGEVPHTTKPTMNDLGPEGKIKLPPTLKYACYSPTQPLLIVAAIFD